MARKRSKSTSASIPKKEPTTATSSVAPVTVPTKVGVVPSAPPSGETGPSAPAASAESKTAEKQEAGTKK